MARRAFYSFHYIPDNWRASQVRNMGVVDGNKPATDNDWEAIKKKHPYEVPEFVVLPIKWGSQDYLNWISASIEGSD